MKIPELKNPIIYNSDGTFCLIIYSPSKKTFHSVLVSGEDLYLVCNFMWHIGSGGYAKTKINNNAVGMANVILKTNSIVDHINRDRLDNRRCNLRVATSYQNSLNKSPLNKTSKYKGVSLCKQTGKFVVRIKHGGKYLNLGRFLCEKDAAIAYNKKASELFGEFAYLNDVD